MHKYQTAAVVPTCFRQLFSFFGQKQTSATEAYVAGECSMTLGTLIRQKVVPGSEGVTCAV